MVNACSRVTPSSPLHSRTDDLVIVAGRPRRSAAENPARSPRQSG